jgi:hypothetical protein
MYNSIVDFPIPNKTRITVVSSGWDTDFVDLSKIDRDSTIVIAVNSAIQLVEADYYVASDHCFLEWAHERGYHRPNQLWFSREKSRKLLDKLGHKYVVISDIMKRTYAGSGSEAMFLAYYLHHFITKRAKEGGGKPLEYISYSGIPMAAACDPSGHRYFYASKITDVPPFHSKLVLPAKKPGRPEWDRYTMRFSTNACQLRQFRQILGLFSDGSAFGKATRCDGFVDFAKVRRPNATAIRDAVNPALGKLVKSSLI